MRYYVGVFEDAFDSEEFVSQVINSILPPGLGVQKQHVASLPGLPPTFRRIGGDFRSRPDNAFPGCAILIHHEAC
jgi:hypothetical protein